MLVIRPSFFDIVAQSDHMIDFNHSCFISTLSIKKADGTDIGKATGDFVGVINSIGQSLGKQIELMLNDTPVMESNGMHAYQSYLETILTYDETRAKNYLKMTNWVSDASGKESAAYPTAASTKNPGLNERSVPFDNSATVKVMTKPHVNVCNQLKYLLPGEQPVAVALHEMLQLESQHQQAQQQAIPIMQPQQGAQFLPIPFPAGGKALQTGMAPLLQQPVQQLQQFQFSRLQHLQQIHHFPFQPQLQPPQFLPQSNPPANNTDLHHITTMNNTCPLCGAKYFKEEQNTRNKYTKCCREGAVTLPQTQPPHAALMSLFLAHLHPLQGQQPKYAELYIMDMAEALEHRANNPTNRDLNRHTIKKLQDELLAINLIIHIQRHDGYLIDIKATNPAADPLKYSLLFPFGEHGVLNNLEQSEHDRVRQETICRGSDISICRSDVIFNQALVLLLRTASRWKATLSSGDFIRQANMLEPCKTAYSASHGIAVNFSGHGGYYSAYNYAKKEDRHVLYSDSHPDIIVKSKTYAATNVKV
eukprot:gene1780-biopygen1624